MPDADRFTGDQLTIHNTELFNIREHVIGYVRDAGGYTSAFFLYESTHADTDTHVVWQNGSIHCL